MKCIYSFIAVLFLVLLTNSISLAQDWVKTSDPPAGANQFKVATGIEDGNDIQFLLETSGLGLFKSTDDGTTWDNIGLVGVGITAIWDHPGNAGEYVVSASDGVHKTTDGGTTWQHYTSGIEGLFITDIVRITFDFFVVGTVGNGVFKSTDDGETWQQMGTGLENKTVTSVELIKFDAVLNDGLYATTQEDGVWVYDPSNETWAPINDGNNNLVGTTAIAGDPQGNLYAAISPNICSSPYNPVFWQVETEHDFTNTIVVTPNDQVFASSFGDGIKVRDLNGNWTDFSSGIPVDPDGYTDIGNLGRFTFWFNSDFLEKTQNLATEQYLWAAYLPLHPSMSPGIYRTVNPVTDVKDKIVVNPEDFSLEQNYPNPFNPSTTISYSIPNSSFVTIKVYDVLGNEIAQLVNEEKSVGVHEVTFDASNLSTGTYFYHLQAVSTSSNSGKNFVVTRKMILLK